MACLIHRNQQEGNPADSAQALSVLYCANAHEAVRGQPAWHG